MERLHQFLFKLGLSLGLIAVGLMIVISVANWIAGEIAGVLRQSAVGTGMRELVTGVVAVLHMVIGVGLPLAVLVGAGWVWWRLSFPRRATVVLTRLVGSPPDERPRLRRLWRRGSVWRLAWMMPIGATVQKVRTNQAVLEEALDCGVRVWFDHGLLRAEFGVMRLPERVGYAEFIRSRSRATDGMALPIPLGVSRQGRLWVDMPALPHLLVGGTTNFGKSAFLRSVLATLAVRHDPARVRFLLADLKSGVEFNLFGDLPHLWHPLMVDLEDCEIGLGRANQEIDRRLSLLRIARVENIARYNAAHRESALPYLVVVVDEVGELRPGDVTDKEERGARQRVVALLVRIGRVGRAAGVHLICATQRPDADTVGGQLKAQLPATVAFYTRDDTNSRILLDNSAAADLPAQPGRAIWQHGADQVQMQVPNLELAEAASLLAGVACALHDGNAVGEHGTPNADHEREVA